MLSFSYNAYIKFVSRAEILLMVREELDEKATLMGRIPFDDC